MTRNPDPRAAGANDGANDGANGNEYGGEYADGAAEGAPEVHSITSAAPGHSVDMHQRMVRYAIAMGIRMVCIIALFFLDGWFKLIAVAGAVFLPWIAVVIANAQTQGETYESELLDHVSYGELGTGYVEDDEWGASGQTIQGQTIQGETVDDGAEPARAPEPTEPTGNDNDQRPQDPEAGAA